MPTDTNDNDPSHGGRPMRKQLAGRGFAGMTATEGQGGSAAGALLRPVAPSSRRSAGVFTGWHDTMVELVEPQAVNRTPCTVERERRTMPAIGMAKHL